MAEQVDVVVIGAGIVGLATANELAGRNPAAKLVVVDAADKLAAHQSGRNSGVLHSGIYYRPGSLKATLAVAGRDRMVEYCRHRDIAHDICGKVIVATSPAELERLSELAARAQANGVEVTSLSPAEVREREPFCVALGGLWVPSTGVCDFTQVCAALAHDITQSGGEVRLRTRVHQLTAPADKRTAHVGTDGDDLEARLVVNCAGLRTDQVADMVDARAQHRIVPFRGEYYELAPRAQHLVRGLIYPVPDPAFPFLGVHLTRGIDGHIHAGPNAVLALHREGYRWRDVSRRQLREHATNRGLWRLARRHAKTGAGEVWRSLSKRAFARALQRLVPDVSANDLIRAPAGVRAQAMDPTGELLDDFAIRRQGRTVHVLNAPSPGATASLAIGAHIANEVADLLNE